MGVVDITETNPAFFIVTALFVTFILSMFSLGVLRMFQGKRTQGVMLIGAGLIGIAAFVIVIASGVVTL
ncbi:hypothetical protein ACFQWB_05950 [Paenibacillus thermoaerophilus]|uniref:Uncharacterized protein n=1 Tax=Paenibacillus thermoaerophilus TaxID=1215385 RepID=A0ABW2V5D1_9BACL|nr:hypothetical protein [Paenibacillus thermoaerophilus]TMV18248.1 hypothetical protein FE781_04705 [Paenibacillus thermoaerophilus]